MKHCNSCGTTKNESEFGARKASPDGLAAKCRDCQKSYDKARLKDPKRVAARAAYAKTDDGLARGREAKARWIAENPNKRKAHLMVDRVLRSGALKRKPCEVCGAEQVDAHHDDYAEPLAIRWLCPQHHRDWHRANGEALNP